MRRTHIYSGIVLILSSIYCLAWFIPQNTVKATSEIDISPAFVPSMAVATGLVLAIIMTVRAWRLDPESADELDEEFGAEATGIDREVLANTLVLALISVVSWLIMEYVGFEPSMTVFLIATMLYVGVKSWWTIILASVLSPIVLSQLSYHLFSTVLPGFWR